MPGVAKHNHGAPEKSDRLFGERRSSGVIESLRKQFFEGAGARDTELVTTTERSDPRLCIMHCALCIFIKYYAFLSSIINY